MYPEILKGTKSFKMKVENPVVQVLAEDAALIGFTALAELITLDNKVSDVGTGAYTYVWKKIDGQWKIVHITNQPNRFQQLFLDKKVGIIFNKPILLGSY